MLPSGQPAPGHRRITFIYTTLLVLILLVGAYLRFVGLNWGEYQYLHPDERFLVWVGSDISPVEHFSDYWDTATSSLNPHNRGHSFYVYGTLPMFLTRYVVEWIYGHSGFNEMTDVGRALSALFDLSTVLLVFLVGRQVYSWRVGLLAAAFSALAVLQIQHAHFFTMDTFTTFFALLTVLFAVLVAYRERVGEQSEQAAGGVQQDESPGKQAASAGQSIWRAIVGFASSPVFLYCLGFGVALGMAMASKIHTGLLAFLLPIALYIPLSGQQGPRQLRRLAEAFAYLALAGVVAFLVFRIFQPYAFSGPGFFGLKPNPAWIANLNELRTQATGDVDFPPAIQWARRPVWFAWENMVRWGLGLPLGLLAWAGFLWIGWRILKGEWKQHILLWGWTAFYFTWQSLVFNPSMRYQLLIYPLLAIFAGWAIVRLYDWGRGRASALGEEGGAEVQPRRASNRWVRWVAILIGGLVLATTAVYAFAFSAIYTRPITRVAASRWIYQNIPGAIDLKIGHDGDVYNQQIPFPYNLSIGRDNPFSQGFAANRTGVIKEIELGKILDPQANFGEKRFNLSLSEAPGGISALTTASGQAEYPAEDAASQIVIPLTFGQATPLEAGKEYFLSLALDPGQGPMVVNGDLQLEIQGAAYAEGGPAAGTQLLPLQAAVLSDTPPYTLRFVPSQAGLLTGATLQLEVPQTPAGKETLQVALSTKAEVDEAQASVSLTPELVGREGTTRLVLDKPLAVEEGQLYYLTIRYDGPRQGLTLQGTAVANEGAWDDGLPVRLDNYDGFGGIYVPGLNFDMYEDDGPNKLARFVGILDRSEYIFISSSRQWGSLPRLPERFPMNIEYFRRLMGCPPDLDVPTCYTLAQPGDFQGDLGFELVKVFESDPQMGPWRVNDQFAEEAFTVYDHPKVFIFKKQPSYDPERARAILGAIDLSKVVHVTPKAAESLPKDMMLTPAQASVQKAGGTWSELFDTDSLINRWPFLTALVWYLAVSALAWLAYPLIRFALPGLSDRGFPFSRIAGLLILSYLVWLGGSFQLSFSRLTITLAILLIALASAAVLYLQRGELGQEWRERRNYFLLIEGLFLAFFIFDLLIRVGNPDLWHPWKGGEKPMDFSYFNAVLKSTIFPPYDPWFAGGYINYYYYGFVLVGVLVKWLGIVPAVAYNLIIPTVFSLIAMGAFSVGWNLKVGRATLPGDDARTVGMASLVKSRTFLVGIAAAIGMAVLGNLGTLRMILVGYQRVAAPNGVVEGMSFLARSLWTLQGAIGVLAGKTLPYGLPDWYWLPSRSIPAPNDVEPITEFPFFTVLYGDPHAHLFALPLTLLALAWALSLWFGRGWRRPDGKSRAFFGLQVGASLLLGGLAIGALRPTNTWDFPTYLAIGMVFAGYAVWKNYAPAQTGLPGLREISPAIRRIILAAIAMLLLVGLSFLLYRPYAEWYVQSYTHIDAWKGTHTPFWSYLTHWGLFLFVIISWMAWETRDWMANTPLSALRKLAPYRGLIIASIILLLIWIAILFLMDIWIGWFAILLAIWAGLLLLKPALSDAKRAVLLLVAGGLLLTLVVEVIVLRGDIGRMNTVFKFYLQVWTLFAVSAAACLGWLLGDLPLWRSSWRTAWQAALAILLFGAALFPLLGSVAKVKDRMAPDAPHTLDGMAFMRFAFLDDLGVRLDLSQDYAAIRWLQENVQGSPVIMEGNMVEYHWGTRNTIYTGLPNIIGWNWHQRQQRGSAPENLIWDRIAEVGEFYSTPDLASARAILNKYGVEYFIVGQLERALYPGPGLDKFAQADGSAWKEVFRQGDTAIYQVINSP